MSKKKHHGRKLRSDETLEKEDFNFSRNAVYCKYYDEDFTTDGGKTWTIAYDLVYTLKK